MAPRVNRFAIWTLAAAAWLGNVAAAEETATPASSAPATSWTLSTDDTKLTLGIGKDRQLYIEGLSSPKADWNWTREPSLVPLLGRVDMDGKQYVPHWVFQDAAVDSSAGGRKVTICFTTDKPAMELLSVWHARPGPGPVRHTMFIKNNAGGPVTIYEQESLDVHLVGPKTGVNIRYVNDDRAIPDAVGVYCDRLKAGYQKTLPVTADGADWVPFVVVDADGQCGAYVGWEWSNGRMTISADPATNGARLKAGNGDNFRTDLSAGEMFEVPPGFLGAYAGDLDDCGNSLRRYLFSYNMPEVVKNDATFPKVEWNAFAATGKKRGGWDPVESKYYPLIDDIAPLGFEEVVIDVGWWSSHGKPEPGHIVTDAVDWPKGMAAAAKYARDRGMRFGLYDNRTEPLTNETGRKTRKAEIAYLLKELQADFYRSDSTAGPSIQGKFGPDQRAHYPEDVMYWATKGFYEILDSLHADIPTFLWENCQCGGAMKDFGATRRSAKIQNQDRYYPIDARRAFYDASHIFPSAQLMPLVGTWDEWQSDGSVYEFRSAALGAATWHPDAPNGGNGGPAWSDWQKAKIKKAVAVYKERLRPLIRNADLYHIFPRPDGLNWDGIEYFDPAAKRGVVYLFKPSEQNGNDTMKVKLRGVRPEAKYRVTFEDGTNPASEKSGAELISGIDVRLCGGLVSEWMFFEEIAPAK